MTTISEHQKSGRVIKVLQITDTHLFADSNDCLLGLNTEQSLASVIKEAQAQHMPADLVLATGDLAHDGTAAAYQRAISHLGSLKLPVYCLPGNHDETETMQQTLQHGRVHYTTHASHGNWHFIFLDSTIPASEGAHLTPATLQSLELHLQSAPGAPTLVCLHHQPVPMGSRWLDTMAVDNPDDFFNIIDRHSQVRGILWGHVHQTLDTTRKDVKLMASPSTCIQFMPGSIDFTLDSTAPGYRWLQLHPDGRIETGIQRIAFIADSVDLASSGY